MSTSSFHLRNVSPKLMSFLKKEAAKQKISVNSLILHIIEHGIGIARPTKKNVYHDLDHLAGTWSIEDSKTFDAHIKPFENIDQDLWT